jgi:hypothetical protein
MNKSDYPTCRTCRWWQEDKDGWVHAEILRPYDPVTHEAMDDEAQIKARYGHIVRVCKSPRLLFDSRPDADGATVCDGSHYMANLLTGESYGCIHHEPK